jgi:DNA polymerase elongation subunit (family B)
MIKVFQAEVFEKFLEGKTLEECYASVGKVANDYMDLLYNKGSKLPDEELLDLISERCASLKHQRSSHARLSAITDRFPLQSQHVQDSGRVRHSEIDLNHHR